MSCFVFGFWTCFQIFSSAPLSSAPSDTLVILMSCFSTFGFLTCFQTIFTWTSPSSSSSPFSNSAFFLFFSALLQLVLPNLKVKQAAFSPVATTAHGTTSQSMCLVQDLQGTSVSLNSPDLIASVCCLSHSWVVGVSQGNGDPCTCDFDLGLAGIWRPCKDFSLAVVLTAGCNFDFGFSDVSSSSLSMNSLLTIWVFFSPATRVSPFLFSLWASLWQLTYCLDRPQGWPEVAGVQVFDCGVLASGAMKMGYLLGLGEKNWPVPRMMQRDFTM